MLRFALFFFLIGLYSESFSQKSIGLSFGGQYMKRQDVVLSPMIYQNFSPLNVQIQYQSKSVRAIQEVSLAASSLSLSAQRAFQYIEPEQGKTVSTNPSRLIVMDARYSYLRRFSTEKKVNWAIGGVFDNQIVGHFQEYGYNGAFGYTTVSALSLAGQGQTALGQKSQLSVKAFVPLVAWVARSPFAVNDDVFIENQKSHRALRTVGNLIADGSVQWLPVFQQFNCQITFNHHINKRLCFVIADELEVISTQQPRPLRSWRNQLSVGLMLQL